MKWEALQGRSRCNYDRSETQEPASDPTEAPFLHGRWAEA